MMTDETARQRDAAFALLLEVLDAFAATGRRPFSAGVKAEMLKRSNDGFSETRLGYPTFRAFLADAEERGQVKLSPAPTGPDVLVSRPAGTQVVHRARSRIRPDIWRAFVDWRPDWRRVYDTVAREAYMYPATPHAVGELPEYTQLRARVEEEPSRYVPIPAIEQELQLRWMREFVAAEADREFAGEMVAALDTQRPAAAFTNLLRAHPSALARWNRYRQEHVAETIQSWAANLPTGVDYLEVLQPEGHTSTSPPLPTDERALRETIRRAVDAMPIADLLKLSIPLEYLIQR